MASQNRPFMKTVQLTEDQAKNLADAGVFSVVLIHPRVEVYETDDSVVILVPGKGAVQVSTKDA